MLLSLDTTRAQRVCNAQIARVNNPGSATCVRDGSGDLLLVTVFRRAARDTRVAIGASVACTHDPRRLSSAKKYVSVSGPLYRRTIMFSHTVSANSGLKVEL